MKKQSYSFEFTEYEYSELTVDDQELVNRSFEAADQAYAPYSLFNVGAALRMEDNRILIGNNQENSAYPSGLCAERVALFAASANFPNLKVNTLAIAVKTELVDIDIPLSPCGSCRQVMIEYENKQKSPIRVLLADKNKRVWEINKSTDLLPFHFHEDNLKK